MNLSKLNISALKLYISAVVDCDSTFSQTKEMNSSELIKWFTTYTIVNEMSFIPKVEDVICVECMVLKNENSYGDWICNYCE